MLFTYSLRSLLAHRTAVIPTIFGTALSIATIAVMALAIGSIERTMVESGRPDNVLIMHQTARELAQSELPIVDLPRLKLLPGVAKQDGTELATAEAVMIMRVKSTGPQALPQSVNLRGVDPSAYKVHDAVRVTAGAAPAPGTPGVLVGEQWLGRLQGVEMGGFVRVGHRRWPVVGTFVAPGTFYESEIWCDRSALLAELQRTNVNALVVRAADVAGVATMKTAAAALREPAVQAISEREYAQSMTTELVPYILVAWALAIALMVGAVFACVSNMHALTLARRREFATLLAIGFRRGQVLRMLAVEIMLLVVTGTAVGLTVSSFLLGKQFIFEDWRMVVHMAASTRDAMLPIGVAAGIAGAGIAITLYQIGRLKILEALRAA